MKKKIVLFLSLLLAALTPVSSLRAESSEEPLYKFVRDSDGNYGYDEDTAVEMYQDSGDQVMIPASYIAPKRQFRTSWVATISNLHMAQPDSEEDFQEKYLEILDRFTDWNMNAMIFQVSPLLDAYYPSQFRPWSGFLSGEQGVDPGYDPLAWMIEETHNRAMEYHAWFNPYRVTYHKISSATITNALGMSASDALQLDIEDYIGRLNDAGVLADDNFAVLHPDWVLRFDEKLFLNPGLPEVRQYVIDTIAEVVTNYDIDAVHFDDYFYPYRVGSLYFGDLGEDYETFQAYGITQGYSDDAEGIEEWRRDNVTALVEGVKEAIDLHNEAQGKSVQFGISPFGIWEHISLDDRGSNTPESSSQSYSKSIYADTYKWVKEETLDYILPQIYWSFDQAAAPYGELTSWWDSVAEGTRVQLYIGHANYKHVGNGGWEAAWMNPEEIPNQLKFNQKYSNVAGSAFYGYHDIIPTERWDSLATSSDMPKHKAKNKAIDILKNQYFNTPALAPAKPWLAPGEISAPVKGYFEEDSNTSFTWQDSPENFTRYYVVYRGTGTAEEIISHPENIIAKVWNTNDLEMAYTDSSREQLDENVKYVVTALDAAHNESNPLLIQERSTENTNNEYSGVRTGSKSSGEPAAAGEWRQDAKGWWYRYSNGTWPASCWKKINDIWYYFGEDGYMATGWLQDQGKWYFLNPGGNMVSRDWTYYKDSWYYLLESGEMASGQWIQYNEKWYYMGGNGIMLTNGITPDGARVDSDGVWIP